MVVIQYLDSMPALNGQAGVLLKYDEIHMRWKVKMSSSGEKKWIKNKFLL